ncbi:FAD-dependent oxidoreductase, partial [Pelomonas sp. KK5]|uniref:FAD-dependent oxidoreductase n=1 Tax=Pelomonas sp. KK5 TaxID=1855730 RepID=UPI00117CBB73
MDQTSITPISPPLQIASPDALAWDDAADVIVVGWGAAGACAALEARAAGVSVLVVDRFQGGGASALSGGVVYAGGGTRQQREAGVADSPAAMADYLRHEVQDAVSPATLQRFCADSAANLEWLERQGARFGATLPEHKTSYPPDGVFLYHSGNELVAGYRGAEPPAPRGHRAVAKGQSGAALFEALRTATQRSGARTLTQAAVRRLVRAGERIVGVEVWCLSGEAAREHAALNRRIERWRLLRPARCQRWRDEAAALERQHAVPRLLRA